MNEAQQPQNRIVKKTMSYVENNPMFNERQLVALVQRTPKHHVKERKGRGGRSFKYVTGAYVQDKLNQVFGWGWSFEVKSHGQSPQGSLWVLGKITIIDPKTGAVMVTKEQFGSSEYKTDASKKEVDYADDLKAATTDALKKCASLLGVAADIYADPETATAIHKRIESVVQYQQQKKKEETQEAQDGDIIDSE